MDRSLHGNEGPVNTHNMQATFVDHPIGAVQGVDPLASLDPPSRLSEGPSPADNRLRLGYAAFWEPVPQRTLSGSAWNLREKLRLVTDTVDLGVEFPTLTRYALKGIHTRYRSRLTTSWNNSRLTDLYIDRTLSRAICRSSRQGALDAVLMVDSMTTVPAPFFTYYDSSWDSAISSADSLERYAALRRLTPANVLRRRDKQLAIYERATGIIVWSRWLARSLVEQSGIPADKIHVIPPASVAKSGNRPAPSGDKSNSDDAARHKLLFVGRLYEASDFYRKGGDLVVEALEILRRDYDPRTTLTMVGMEKWPLPGEPPAGVNFRGVIPPQEVAELYDTHDVFVMPSRMEPFGIVFAEALARGIPCVARNAYAMPEVITPGISGALIERDDPYELAAAITSVLTDDELYKKVYERVPEMAAYFSWERAANQVVDVISNAIR